MKPGLGNDGQGLVFEFDPVQGVMFAAWYTYEANAGIGSDASGQDWYTLQAAAPHGANALRDIDIFKTSDGVFDRYATSTTTPVGSADLAMRSCTRQR